LRGLETIDLTLALFGPKLIVRWIDLGPLATSLKKAKSPLVFDVF
jgi:hypothetical protein